MKINIEPSYDKRAHLAHGHLPKTQQFKFDDVGMRSSDVDATSAILSADMQQWAVHGVSACFKVHGLYLSQSEQPEAKLKLPKVRKADVLKHLCLLFLRHDVDFETIADFSTRFSMLAVETFGHLIMQKCLFRKKNVPRVIFLSDDSYLIASWKRTKFKSKLAVPPTSCWIGLAFLFIRSHFLLSDALPHEWGVKPSVWPWHPVVRKWLSTWKWRPRVLSVTTD